MKTTVSTCLGKLLPSEEILTPFVFFLTFFKGGDQQAVLEKKIATIRQRFANGERKLLGILLISRRINL